MYAFDIGCGVACSAVCSARVGCECYVVYVVFICLLACVLDVIIHFSVSVWICFMRSDAHSPVLTASLVLEREFRRLFGLESVTVIWLKLSWPHNVSL